MANQFTKGTRKHHDEATKDKTRAELLMQRLSDCAEGKKELTSVQVAAAKVVLDKVKPSLQAIQQTTEDPWQERTEDELLEMVQALITSHPRIAQRLNIGIRAVDQPGMRGDDATNAAQHDQSEPNALKGVA